MRETKPVPSSLGTTVDSFRAALATVLELPPEQLPVPQADEDPASGWTVSRWLGGLGLGLGLVRVADAQSFAWAGPWIGRVEAPSLQARFVVMYGVPSGVVWDPSGDGFLEHEWLADGTRRNQSCERSCTSAGFAPTSSPTASSGSATPSSSQHETWATAASEAFKTRSGPRQRQSAGGV
jgi:hypothetical protein